MTLYCDFFSGSGLVEPEALPLAEPEALPLLGGVLLGLELLGLEVLPPDAEPDLDGSVALGELELPPDGEVDEDELEPELDGGVDDGDELLLPLEPADLPVPLSWPQAARPKAMATAIARVESLMCPPWLGYEREQQRTGPA